MAVKLHTIDEFEQIIERPENADRLFEFIGGEIVEVPSNPFSSAIASLISFYIRLFLRQNHIEGHVTGEAGGYQVSGERYAPDVAYLSKTLQPELVQQGYNPAPPQLAVEVVSPTDNPRKLQIKIANYLAAGTLLWVVYPEDRTIEVYRPGKPVEVVDEDGTLSGEGVLPGFTLPVRDIFQG